MHPCTAVIDIGSNSARLVIYQESSNYGFHLVCERKSKVRIGEGAYEAEGYLQPIGINRAFLALEEFIKTTKNYPTTKILAVATSALRDAPNGAEFVQWIKEKLNLDIQIIDGKTEAHYGAIAAQNLLPITEGISIDIGGGSSDLALIKDSKIIDTYSLNLGTVRLKELFFDKERPIQESQDFIRKALEKLPKHFKNTLAIGIGGTARTLSGGIMKYTEYPFDNIHAFTYTIDKHQKYFQNISEAKITLLQYLYLPKGRFDTIREGTLIWQEILKHIQAKEVITSGVGVREGVFLKNFLKKEPDNLFPNNINPSIVSMLDRFKSQHINTQSRIESGEKLFMLFKEHEGIKEKYIKVLRYALQLSPIGYKFNIYQSFQHTFYVAMQEFNYKVTHEELILTAMILRSGGKNLYKKELYNSYKRLLPPKSILEYLSFIFTIISTLYDLTSIKKFDFTLKNNLLTISSQGSLYLATEKLKEIQRPKELKLKIIDKTEVPLYSF